MSHFSADEHLKNASEVLGSATGDDSLRYLSLLLLLLLPLLPLLLLLLACLLFAWHNRSKVLDISGRLKPDQFAGKTVLLTGANSGIGAACAVEFASRGATVHMLVRSASSGAQAVSEVRRRTQHGKLLVHQLDLACPRQVAAFCAKFQANSSGNGDDVIDILVNNAGVFAPPYGRTADGLDPSLASNHLGHFLLTSLLLARNLVATDGRLVLVTGAMYKSGCVDVTRWNRYSRAEYSGVQAYYNSKLAICLFGIALHRKFTSTSASTSTSPRRQQVFLVHPGVVGTNISRHLLLSWPAPIRSCVVRCAEKLMLSSRQGCQGILACAVAAADSGGSDAAAVTSGGYHHNCCPEPWQPFVLADSLVAGCLRESVALVADCLATAATSSDLAGPAVVEELRQFYGSDVC